MLWQTVHVSLKKQVSSMEKCVLSITDTPMPVFLGTNVDLPLPYLMWTAEMPDKEHCC